MPREWTDEQRAEASERAKERGFGRPVAERQAGKVEVHANPPVTRSPAVFIAENEARPMEVTEERAKGEDGSAVTTTHTRAGTLTMYKPLEHGGYEPRTVSAKAISMLLGEGWAEVCPECGKRHLDKQGQETADPNLCSARPPVAVIICPVCHVRIYDNMAREEVEESDEDANVINPGDLQASTPEDRLVAARNLHMWMSHPRSAQERNLPPVPEALRGDMVEARQG